MRTLLVTLVSITVLVVGLSFSVGVSARPAGANPVADEQSFIQLINQLRVDNGLAPLAVHAELTAGARSWSSTMAGNDALAHSPNMAAGVTASWTVLGENVGMHGVHDVDDLFQAFVASPGHYKNLTDPRFHYVGVGVSHAPNGKMWTTHRFMATTSADAPSPPSPAPNPPAAPPSDSPTTAAPGDADPANSPTGTPPETGAPNDPAPDDKPPTTPVPDSEPPDSAGPDSASPTTAPRTGGTPSAPPAGQPTDPSPTGTDPVAPPTPRPPTTGAPADDDSDTTPTTTGRDSDRDGTGPDVGDHNSPGYTASGAAGDTSFYSAGDGRDMSDLVQPDAETIEDVLNDLLLAGI